MATRERVVPSEDKNLSFISPASAAWSLSLTPAQYHKLLLGFSPQDMEDRWYVCAVDDTQTAGTVLVKYLRSWTNNLIFEIEVVGGKESPKVMGIKWEESLDVVAAGQSVDQSKEMVRGLSEGLLDVKLPADE